MEAVVQLGDLAQEALEAPPSEHVKEMPVWQQASAWLALLPLLFITVNGSIQTDSSPVAFRFTAMDEDSLGRRLMRLGCSIVIVFLLSTRIRSILAVCKRSKLILLLPTLAFASVLWSQSPRHTVVDALNLSLTTLFAICLYLRYPGERIVSFLTLGASVSLFLCLLSVLVFPSVGIDAFQQDAWRGIFGQRNYCAAACTLFLVVALHARAHGIVERMIQWSVLILAPVFVVMSASRAGWIIALFAVALTFGLRLIARFRSLDRLLLLMVLTVPATMTVLFIFGHSTEILAAMDKDPTLTQRTIIWAQVLPSIAKHPLLGYGYSAFWTGLNGESMQTILTTGWMEGQAQDGYLDVILQLGIVGLIPLIVAFLRGFGRAVTALEKGMTNWAVLCSIVLIPIILIENIGESSLLEPLKIPWFYALIALFILEFPSQSAEEI